MIFDNRNTVMRLNIRRYLVLIVYVIFTGFLILSDLFGDTILGLKKSIYILSSSILYILYIAYTYILNYKFLSYSDEGVKLTFKFISLRPFDNKKQAIEIHKKDFRAYKFEKSFFNLKQDLVLVVKTKNGVANYPPISISALSGKYKSILISSLNQFVKRN